MRRRLLLATVASGIFIAHPAAASDEELAIGPAPEWVQASQAVEAPDDAAGMLYVRRQDVLSHLDASGQSTYYGNHYKLLQPQALSIGNLSVIWNPASGKPTVHKVHIIRDGQIIDVLANSEFEVVRKEDQLEQSMLNGQLTAVLRVPDLRVGDELDWAVTIPTQDPTLGDDSYGLMLLADAPMPGSFHLGLSWEEGQEPTIRPTKDLAQIAQRGTRSFDVRLLDPDLASVPANAPPRYSWQRIIEYSDFGSWSDVSRRFNALFDKASLLEPDSPLKEEAARIANAYPTKREQAEAALELVQQQVRYVYVGLNGGNFTPVPADETWRLRYGDCKGKTALLLALLNELDIDAHAVLANNSGTDDGLTERLPNPALFDHVLVRAKIGKEQLWLDGTLPVVIGPGESPFIRYRSVLPLSAKGQKLEAVKWDKFALPQEMGIVEIDAREGFDAPAKMVQQSISRGVEGLSEYRVISALAPSQRLAIFSKSFTEKGDWYSVDAVDYRYDRETQASILTIKGSAPVDWESHGEGTYSLTLPGGGFYAPDRRQRSREADEKIPYYNKPGFSCYATTVRVPQDTDIKDWGLNASFDKGLFGRLYYRRMERRDDGTIRMVRASRTELTEITSERAKRDNERLKNFDNSKAQIWFDPAFAESQEEMVTYMKEQAAEAASQNGPNIEPPGGDFSRLMPWNGSEKVPATYEIDWAGKNVPCLPDDLMDGG